ncbi:MAG: undecaprenyl-phosphate galactose phosphotransferase WbaP [Alphaproteobacteria bacterium]|nr:undecaprenyl-phosphate galactose phosphotransferase WbaP [Alphaproteobacteria bacterium]
MVQISLKNKAAQAKPQIHEDVDNMLAQVENLAREARQPEITETINEAPRSFPNFTRLLQISGRYLMMSDIVALLAAFTCGGVGAWAVDVYLFNEGFQELFHIMSLQQFAIFTGLGAVALLWLDTKGHYRQRLPYWEVIGHLVAVVMLGFLAGGFIQFASKNDSSRLWMGLSWLMFGVFLLTGRTLVRRMLEKHGLWKVPAVMIGTGPTAQAAMSTLNRERKMGFALVKQIDASALETLSKPHAWKHLLMTHGASHIFLALEGSEVEKNSVAIKSMVRARVPCSIIPAWLGLPSSTLSPHHFMMHDVVLLHNTNRLQLPLPRLLKRSFDILLAGTALVVLSPLFAGVALLVRRDGGPAFFKQARVGRGGRLFNCYKFRSMRIDAEKFLARYLIENPAAAQEWRQFQKLKNDVRVTKFGQFIRRTSLDELPQLINVLKGEMSLVGPRPCMPGQEDFYAEDFSFYESVRPGITGPWQVSGRNKLTFKERVQLESWYARNWSLWMDVVIVLKTVPTLLKKDQAF